MPEDVSEILWRAICPDVLFDDDYDSFVYQRAEMLARAAEGLMD
jgi:hypothetical protein